jgi:hypothetical protein
MTVAVPMVIVVMVAVMAIAVVAPVSIPIVNNCWGRNHFNRLRDNGLFYYNGLLFYCNR